MKAGGVLERKDLGNILDDHVRFPPDRHHFIIEMMRKFELCFDFPDAPDRLLIPDLLSPNEPDLNWPSTREALNLEYHYNILPSSLLSRFIVRIPTVFPSGRTGEAASFSTSKATRPWCVPTKSPRIYVSIVGPAATRRSALSAIRNEFRAIHGSISALEAREKVPLPEDQQRSWTTRNCWRWNVIASNTSLASCRTARPAASMSSNFLMALHRRRFALTSSAWRRRRCARRFCQKRAAGSPRQVTVEPATFQPAPPPRPEVDPMQARHRRQEQQQIWEKIAIFAIGVAFVVMLVAIALWVPDPTSSRFFIFRGAMALGAGALGALIPGFIEVKFRTSCALAAPSLYFISSTCSTLQN